MPSKAKKPASAAAATSSPTDVSMVEAPPSPLAQLTGDTPSFLEQQRIRILPGSSDTAASFEFHEEDHTLGNALRYIIMKNPEVEFCGYSIPHPSEPKMNLRIQTYDNSTAIEVLEKGFDDLIDLCDVVADKFVSARTDFANNGAENRVQTREEINYDDEDEEL